ncbi:uncharacterized protein Z518_05211 [Rhinocladiella mackenziei CBS 650.93]|uniref:Pyridoxamine 5'-phosphate oxidase putative domain-containing protein n=1 Tax=Rhinocladiella mackenziei CBS 650.93 TaxID=1442369 RepID=A0A0D2H1L1_9EURO|nr:uncharacterized protein Z518_05211 [Rhinocladiella mackenziei CBS 650.93]KIX04343.1 hypothetical protein Z518_05211 [Rhinocladiella mackenziei CBS 650.93]
MVKFYNHIEPDLAEWAMKQQVFFVASAPLRGRHINLSPKGLPSSSFCVLNRNLCAYVDATGSGIETISHIQENGRCTVMFCSFDASPRIMRLFCTGRLVAWNEPGFDGWLKRMGNKNVIGARAVIILDVFKAQTSCGYAVPYLATKPDPDNASKQIAYLEDRNTLGHWAGKQVSNGVINDYRSQWNARSLDGLPGLRIARSDAGERLWYGDINAQAQKRNALQLALVAICSAILTVLSMYMLGLTTLQNSLSF